MVNLEKRKDQNLSQEDVWGQLDSNQRSRKTRDLQSLAIAAMRYPRNEQTVLTAGIEPTTIRLTVGRSAIELQSIIKYWLGYSTLSRTLLSGGSYYLVLGQPLNCLIVPRANILTVRHLNHHIDCGVSFPTAFDISTIHHDTLPYT